MLLLRKCVFNAKSLHKVPKFALLKLRLNSKTWPRFSCVHMTKMGAMSHNKLYLKNATFLAHVAATVWFVWKKNTHTKKITYILPKCILIYNVKFIIYLCFTNPTTEWRKAINSWYCQKRQCYQPIHLKNPDFFCK